MFSNLVFVVITSALTEKTQPSATSINPRFMTGYNFSSFPTASPTTLRTQSSTVLSKVAPSKARHEVINENTFWTIERGARSKEFGRIGIVWDDKYSFLGVKYFVITSVGEWTFPSNTSDNQYTFPSTREDTTNDKRLERSTLFLVVFGSFSIGFIMGSGLVLSIYCVVPPRRKNDVEIRNHIEQTFRSFLYRRGMTLLRGHFQGTRENINKTGEPRLHKYNTNIHKSSLQQDVAPPLASPYAVTEFSHVSREIDDPDEKQGPTKANIPSRKYYYIK